jgi:hypothetical protein
MVNARRDLAFRGAVGAQFARSDPFGNEAPTVRQLDQKPLCRALVSPRLKGFLKKNAVLVARAPEPI